MGITLCTDAKGAARSYTLTAPTRPTAPRRVRRAFSPDADSFWVSRSPFPIAKQCVARRLLTQGQATNASEECRQMASKFCTTWQPDRLRSLFANRSLATARNTHNCSLARSQDLTSSLHFDVFESGTLIVVSGLVLYSRLTSSPAKTRALGATRAVWWKRAALPFFSTTEKPSAILARFFVKPLCH